jgi:uncharacterized protein (DUF1697 family)
MAELQALCRKAGFADVRTYIASGNVVFESDRPATKVKAGLEKRLQATLGKREIYVHYPDGQGRSKLRIAAARDGTARNMNTVAKLVEMASG